MGVFVCGGCVCVGRGLGGGGEEGVGCVCVGGGGGCLLNIISSRLIKSI